MAAVRPQADATAQPWYTRTTSDLRTLNVQAKLLLQQGKSGEAAALIANGETLSKQLLSVPQPTFAATAAAADIDDLYARMLFSNHNYGWARMFFQKNLVRWKYWKPQTPDTIRRFQEAEAAINKCDRSMQQ